ncbi:MAG: hypothetical protein OKBPIBMD_01115 [Chlorobi bacterium]|nr:MAG: hypothetical protein F9K28_10615 [Bacteroidota bacterium]MBV6463678.1 hypothetical protein [Chlorobiota bacterium]MBZ0194865.1 hypothetical protein [Candidatus Kapabacteria bacterium]MCC6331859.1 hypothetical protein [Ignavibacteria bacterium]MCL4277527.1 hypothetical protein [Ignavibacteria bacterium]
MQCKDSEGAVTAGGGDRPTAKTYKQACIEYLTTAEWVACNRDHILAVLWDSFFCDKEYTSSEDIGWYSLRADPKTGNFFVFVTGPDGNNTRLFIQPGTHRGIIAADNTINNEFILQTWLELSESLIREQIPTGSAKLKH